MRLGSYFIDNEGCLWYVVLACTISWDWVCFPLDRVIIPWPGTYIPATVKQQRLAIEFSIPCPTCRAFVRINTFNASTPNGKPQNSDALKKIFKENLPDRENSLCNNRLLFFENDCLQENSSVILVSLVGLDRSIVWTVLWEESLHKDRI